MSTRASGAPVVAAFVAPFLTPATARFVAAAAQLPGVRLGLITTAPAEQVPPELARHLAGHWRVDDALDPRQIAGADTYRVDSSVQLAEVLPALRHVPEVSVEEFVDGEELTVDTVCAGGEILFENVMWYRPRPLQNRLHEWISPVATAGSSSGTATCSGCSR